MPSSFGLQYAADGHAEDDVVGRRHRLHLVVRDVDGRDTQVLLQLLELGPHINPQLGILVAQGLVHQEHAGLTYDGPAQATRCCCPPLSAVGFLSMRGSICCNRATSLIFSSI